jgi:hypothetical protein
METLVPESSGEEGEFLGDLVTEFVPERVKGLVRSPSIAAVVQLVILVVFTGCVGGGYLYGLAKYR